MNRYEVESMLSRKADKWEVTSLQEENRRLQNDISSLKQDVNRAETKYDNLRYAINSLIDAIMNISNEESYISDLIQVKNTI